MKAATEMWEKLEELRSNELKDPGASKKDELLKRKKLGSAAESDIVEISAEQTAALRSQIHPFWGNMLFERSQLESKLGLPGWKENLDSALEQFKLAGASGADILTVLKNHCSNKQPIEGNDNKDKDLNTDVAGKEDSKNVISEVSGE